MTLLDVLREIASKIMAEELNDEEIVGLYVPYFPDEEKVILDDGRYIIYGFRGMGKSTLLRSGKKKIA